MKARSSSTLAVSGFVATLLGVCGANVACQPSAVQCTLDSQCDAIDPVVKYTCGDNGICRKASGPSDDRVPTGPAAPLCKTNGQCILQNDGAASVCRNEKCVSVLSAEVDEVSPNYKDGDPIFVGVIAPVTAADGSHSTYDATYFDTVRLAVEDWHYASGGGLLPLGGLERRPVAAVFCDSKQSAERVRACVDHMIETLKVPAIIFRASDDANGAIPTAVAKDTLVYCSDCDPSDVPPVGTKNLLWYGSPALETQTDLRVRWTKMVVDQARQGVPAGASETEVAYVSSNSLYSRRLGDGMKASMKVDWTQVSETMSTDWHALAKTIVDMTPDVVASSELGIDFHAYLVPEIEAQWGAGPRPHYIASESESFDRRLRQTIGISEDLRRRITGTWTSASPEVGSPDIPTNNYDTFRTAFEASFGYDSGGTCVGFEAIYALSFGLTAMLNGAQTSAAVNGSNLAAGMAMLVGGPKANIVDFKPSEIARGIALLQSRTAIDARGVYTDLEWSPTTGLLTSGAGVWCPSINEFGLIQAEEMWTFDQFSKSLVTPAPDASVCKY